MLERICGKIVANNYWTISGHAGENQKPVMMGKKQIYIYIYNIYINIVRIPEKDGKQERGRERERDKVIYGQLDSLGTHLDMLELYGLKQHVLARFGTRI